MAVTIETDRAIVPGLARFAQVAWGVLAYNIAVIIWGAYVRATGSGAGCGSHWPLCNGEVVPRAPGAATVIEFTHRLTSGLALIGVILLCVWAWRIFSKGAPVRRMAAYSLIFIVVEALLGAGLVLLEYVDQNKSVGRAIYLSAHLANTQFLLAALALTAWFANSNRQWPRFIPRHVLGLLPAAVVVGISGAIAALGDTLFPATSFAEGVRQEVSDAAHFLLRLRVLHPALALITSAYILVAASSQRRYSSSADSHRLVRWVWIFVLVQLVAGVANVFLLAPVWMQLLHLLLADLLWVALVLFVADAGRERAL